ncbi:MAG: Glu-tRNA(Gln) amidotransferase subunit GatE [Thermoplasmatota archaeon]
MDYAALGFKAGLEIHQQLDTHKLFCACPSVITENVDYTFERELRPTGSELGEVDRAALAEARRQRRFVYRASRAATCLVEADEEPPHAANAEGLEVCLTVATLLGSRVVDEIQFMRKIVIDGSATSGFQRTALVALGGKVDSIGIQTICLEEDAARLLEEREGTVYYGLDRLGIPLIEIVTAPDITSPQEAEEVALRIGRLLRATKKVKRGLGTIRQDLNVSISAGNRVEIKGVQDLRSIPSILEKEVERQLELAAVAEELQKRVSDRDLAGQGSREVTDLFVDTSSRTIGGGLEGGGVVRAVKLPGCAGLLGGVRYPEHRLGNELAGVAEVVGGGVMHSDELPAYGIGEEEVRALAERLECGPRDGFALCVGPEEVVRRALEEVVARAAQARRGVPQEVRRARSDGSTVYMRPMPGAARMYPETDVPPITVTGEKKRRVAAALPELPGDKIARYVERGLSPEEARQIVYGDRDHWFDDLLERFPGEGKQIARILLHTLPELESQPDIGGISRSAIARVLEGVARGAFAKEGIPEVLAYLAEHPGAEVEEAVTACGLEALSEEQVRQEIRRLLEEREDLVGERGRRAAGALMGLAMRKLRGRADGELIHRLLQEELDGREGS